MGIWVMHVDYNALAGHDIRRLPVVTSVAGQLQCGGACKGAKKVLLQSEFGSELRFHL